MEAGGDDEAHAEGQAPKEDGHGCIFPFHQFLPEFSGSQLVDDEETHQEGDQADDREHDAVDQRRYEGGDVGYEVEGTHGLFVLGGWRVRQEARGGKRLHEAVAIASGSRQIKAKGGSEGQINGGLDAHGEKVGAS